MPIKRNDGGQAFPASFDGSDGMSLRGWFAGHAMASLITGFLQKSEHAPQVRPGGIVTSSFIFPSEEVCEVNGTECEDLGMHDPAITQSAYRIADAMVAERAKSNE